MDSNTNAPVPSFDLPSPATPETAPGANPNVPPPEVNKQTEQHNMELPAAPAPAPVATPAPPFAQPAPSAAPPAAPAAGQPSAAPVATADDNLTAEDNDLIEKAWVLKAKAIVDQTKDDPYRQNNELNKVKASYIKKRYDKDIKIDEPGQ